MRPSTESVTGNPCDDDTRSTEDDNGDTSTETTHPNPDPPSTASTDQEVMGAGEDIRSIPSRLEGVQIRHQAKKEGWSGVDTSLARESSAINQSSRSCTVATRTSF
ncbi:hypothetical protein L916_07980 [Phytophthora nicotianae]|uniref:Uncharacterized protein n=1 Tax=Phytophthora nicotianae TaxID=4792 RepID=W2J5B8_PHYNI|nr:hypothetical protein L916_07980 [Phytophthora nicotianae]